MDIFLDELEESNAKRKIILLRYNIDFLTASDNDGGNCNGSSHSSYFNWFRFVCSLLYQILHDAI